MEIHWSPPLKNECCLLCIPILRGPSCYCSQAGGPGRCNALSPLHQSRWAIGDLNPSNCGITQCRMSPYSWKLRRYWWPVLLQGSSIPFRCSSYRRGSESTCERLWLERKVWLWRTQAMKTASISWDLPCTLQYSLAIYNPFYPIYSFYSATRKFDLRVSRCRLTWRCPLKNLRFPTDMRLLHPRPFPRLSGSDGTPSGRDSCARRGQRVPPSLSPPPT